MGSVEILSGLCAFLAQVGPYQMSFLFVGGGGVGLVNSDWMLQAISSDRCFFRCFFVVFLCFSTSSTSMAQFA